MDSLPEEILKRHIADYLSPLDACQLSNASKNIQSNLALCATPPRKILSDFSRAAYHNLNDDHGPCLLDYGFEIPIPSQVECHSICISMGWRDQGWGNRESYLVIATGDGGDRERPGRIVFKSGIAPHAPDRLKIVIRPEKDQSYHLWYTVGGGGGHVLRLKDVTVQALVFDDPSRSYWKACRFLTERQTFLPWDDALSPFLEQDRPPATRELLRFWQDLSGRMPLPSAVSEAGLSRTLTNHIDSILMAFDREVKLYDKRLRDNLDDHHRQWACTMVCTMMMEEGNRRQEGDTVRRRRENIFRRVISWGHSAINSRLRR